MATPKKRFTDEQLLKIKRGAENIGPGVVRHIRVKPGREGLVTVMGPAKNPKRFLDSKNAGKSKVILGDIGKVRKVFGGRKRSR